MSTSDYKLLRSQVAALIGDEPDALANASNFVGLLYNALDDINWLGIYVLRGEELVLGPFQGKPACVHIAIGDGVCGTAAETMETQLVPEPEQLDRFGEVIDTQRALFNVGNVQGGVASLERIYAVYAAALGWREPPAVRCNAPQYSLVVGAKRELKPCHYLPAVDAWEPGQLKNRVNSPAFIKAREQQRTGQLEACSRCVCFQYWGIRSLWRA